MKLEENSNVEYFIIEIPKEIETKTNEGIIVKTVIEEFYVALIDEIELQVLNQNGYWERDNNLMLYDYAMLDEDGDNDVVKKRITKQDAINEMIKRRTLSKELEKIKKENGDYKTFKKIKYPKV